MDANAESNKVGPGNTNNPIGSSFGSSLSFGQKAAGVTFNPSKDPDVDEIKNLSAQLIDKIDALRRASSGDKARYYSKAISHIEDGQMNAVKAITWQY